MNAERWSKSPVFPQPLASLVGQRSGFIRPWMGATGAALADEAGQEVPLALAGVAAWASGMVRDGSLFHRCQRKAQGRAGGWHGADGWCIEAWESDMRRAASMVPELRRGGGLGFDAVAALACVSVPTAKRAAAAGRLARTGRRMRPAVPLAEAAAWAFGPRPVPKSPHVRESAVLWRAMFAPAGRLPKSLPPYGCPPETLAAWADGLPWAPPIVPRVRGVLRRFSAPGVRAMLGGLVALDSDTRFRRWMAGPWGAAWKAFPADAAMGRALGSVARSARRTLANARAKPRAGWSDIYAVRAWMRGLGPWDQAFLGLVTLRKLAVRDHVAPVLFPSLAQAYAGEVFRRLFPVHPE